MMGLLDLVNVEVTGIATVKIKRNVQMTGKKARTLLADDEAMKALLAENQRFDLLEWDLVYGDKQAPNNIEKTNEQLGAA